MVKIQNMTIANADRDEEYLEVSFIAGWNANGPATLEDSLAVSYKAKHNPTILYSSHSARY